MSIEPYFDDGTVTLYLGDCREMLPELAVKADMILADPPYGTTRLAWDRWPENWLSAVAPVSSTLWCFGSLGVFLDRRDEFVDAGWTRDHEIVWEKHNGSSMRNDRFREVHELVSMWRRGQYGDQYRDVPRIPGDGKTVLRHKRRPTHFGDAGRPAYTSLDGAARLMRSVIRARSMHGRAIQTTQKPVEILEPVIHYSCPPGGLVLDPFAGSGSTLAAARALGRRAIGIEKHEPHIEAAARRLSQSPLPFGEVAA